uniref:RNA-directed RNA polymerase n=1 Tax=Beihai levi-like virus 22 TaxID=1922408 RepID=A0A1L3KHZ3_9VIRU|nr:hypothetical protein [Beihai levi-like virus 22]
MDKKRKRDRKPDANFLPSHIGEAFQNQLVDLVDRLAENGGFKEKYLRSELLSKYCDSKTTPADVRRSSAIKKWQSVEKRNAITNRRLSIGDEDFGWTTSDIIIDDARKFISKVLGTLDQKKVFRRISHTNGASTRISRSPKAAIEKHEGKAHVSSRALGYWLMIAQNTQLSDQELEIQECSELFTVPKSTDIDRPACKEPEINMLLQRCVGGYIRQRLRQFGIDLNDQTRNQELAKTALAKGLATIDLSSASDTVTRSLVMCLLPTEWWYLLDDLRVHWTSIDGEIHYLQMFSSMGNGFTFELESLLFWALTRSICRLSGVRGTISVYGDDIIAPSRIGPRLRRVFAWFGFTVNAKKSHWSGPFRESCGKHYYDGRDVTPFYIRQPVSGKTDIIRLLNRLLVWDGYPYGCFITKEVAEFHAKWAQQIPTSLWGGSDPEDVTSLVTGHIPRKRLFRNSRKLPYNHMYGFRSWLMMTGQIPVPFGEEGFWDQYIHTFQREISEREECLSLSPSVETRYIVAAPEPFRDRSSGVYDSGEVTTWDPYMIYGVSVVPGSY